MKKKKITLNNKNYSYFDIGKGRTILILHGWCSQAEDYIPLVNSLIKEYRVVIPDLPNFGDYNCEKFSFNTYLTFLKSFVEKLQINNPLIIGHSFGGRLALHYAKKNNSDIILINSAGIKIMNNKLFLSLSIIYNSFYESIYGFFPMIKIFKTWFRNFFKNCLKKDFWILLNNILFTDFSFFSEIDSKVILLWSEDDKIFSGNYAKILNSKLKNSELLFTKGGHFSCILNANLFSEKIKKLFKKN